MLKDSENGSKTTFTYIRNANLFLNLIETTNLYIVCIL
jgi:hypothetical protein